MRPTLTLAAGIAAPAATPPANAKLSLEDLRTLEPRDLDDRLHAMGFSRQAAKRVTYLIKAAERATKPAPACSDGSVTLVIQAPCGRKCPHAP